MIICLDSNVIIELLRGKPAVVNKIKEFDEVCTTVLNRYEVLYGALKNPKIEKPTKEFFEHITCLPLTKQAVDFALSEKIRLEKLGKPLDDFDILVGAVSETSGCELFTENKRHLSKMRIRLI